ncbi:unnamed protein product [Cuscuta campestris]|uniref:Uncharacterized protein n=1 Tax=Cuscuta campestris TaxID=132261 RepID=A0A484NI15_9ASTE|nr:unnamed protein product [Cuscuta campestris]
MAKGITKNTPRKKKKEVLAGWATTCYYIWRARNWKRHDKEIQVKEIVRTIKYHCSVSFSSFKASTCLILINRSIPKFTATIQMERIHFFWEIFFPMQL